MKAQQSNSISYSIIFFQLLAFSQVDFIYAQQNDSSKVFTTQFYHEQYSVVVLHSEKNKIMGTRDKKQIPSGLMESSVFINANVSVMPFRDGAFQISPLDTNTWFIPMNMGKDPFKIKSGNCIKMTCWQSQLYQGCPEIKLQNLPDRITFLGNLDANCDRSNMFYINYTPCDSLYGYDFYFGGVIVQADSVVISDPVWFKPNPDATMMFKEDEHGNFIRYYPPKKKD